MIENQAHHIVELLPAYVAGSLGRDEAARVQAHLADCRECQAELTGWQVIADATHLASAAMPARGVLDRALARIDGESPARAVRRPVVRFDRRAIGRPLGVLAAAAVIMGAVVLTPVGSLAQGLLDVFQPRQFTAVPVTMDDLRSLAQLEEYGTFTSPTTAGAFRPAPSAAEASKATGMTVLTPASLPAGVPSAVEYGVIPSQTTSFTFSAEKARAAAAKQNKPLPPMPANIDGSTLQVTTGAGVLAVYGNLSAAQVSGAKGAAGKAERGQPAAVDTAGIPRLIIGQTLAPTVTSTGVSASELEQYLLSQPGISPQLANAIRAIGDPTTTWPVPIPIGQASSHPVQVQGVSGLAVGDSTGLGSGVIWVKNGIVYGVAGSLKESEILQVANSLR